MGPYLKKLFDQAFVTALHNPKDRPFAVDWETALINTGNIIITCDNPSCLKKGYVFSDVERYISNEKNTQPICPYCGTPHKGQIPLLIFNDNDASHKRYYLIENGKYFYKWNIDLKSALDDHNHKDFKDTSGYFSYHQEKWIFVNTKLSDLHTSPDFKQIPIKTGVNLTEGLKLYFQTEPSKIYADVKILDLR
jgi:hypothetical protein